MPRAHSSHDDPPTPSSGRSIPYHEPPTPTRTLIPQEHPGHPGDPVGDLNKGIEADLFARYHFAVDHYRALASAKTPLVRVWVLHALTSMAERVVAFVPDEDHPGELMAKEAFDDPVDAPGAAAAPDARSGEGGAVDAAARWSMRHDEDVADLAPADARAHERAQKLTPLRESILHAYESPVGQADEADAYLARFTELWDDDRHGLLPDALFAAFILNNLRKERARAARLYEEAAEELQPLLLEEQDFALRQTHAGTIFRASYAWRFAGEEDRAARLQSRGRDLMDP